MIVVTLHLLVKPIDEFHVEVEPVNGERDEEEKKQNCCDASEHDTDDCSCTHNCLLIEPSPFVLRIPPRRVRP